MVPHPTHHEKHIHKLDGSASAREGVVLVPIPKGDFQGRGHLGPMPQDAAGPVKVWLELAVPKAEKDGAGGSLLPKATPWARLFKQLYWSTGDVNQGGGCPTRAGAGSCGNAALIGPTEFKFGRVLVPAAAFSRKEAGACVSPPARRVAVSVLRMCLRGSVGMLGVAEF